MAKDVSNVGILANSDSEPFELYWNIGVEGAESFSVKSGSTKPEKRVLYAI